MIAKMIFRPSPRKAWIVTLAGLVLMFIDVISLYLNRSVMHAYKTWDRELTTTIPFAVSLTIGGLIATKRPYNPVGWLWIAFGYVFGCFLSLMTQYAYYGLLISPQVLPLAYLSSRLADISWALGISILTFLLLLFPNGQFLSPRWQTVARLILIDDITGIIIHWFSPVKSGSVPVDNPYALQGVLGEVAKITENVTILILMVSLFVGVLSVLIRFRRSAGVERQQIKWFAYGATLFGVLLMISMLAFQNPGILQDLFDAVTLSALPVTIAIAILRHRLFDIDIIIRRTLVYGALTATLVLVYFGSVLVLQDIFQAITGQHQSSVATVISTLGIAALFTPLRQRLQRDIDRRFYRRKYDAQRTLEAFAARARDEVELEQLTGSLLSVVGETLQPEHASLWLRPVKD